MSKKDTTNTGNINDNVLAPETKAKVRLFNDAKDKFNGLVADFFAAHPDELQQMDEAREEMNAALDEARRALRDDAENVPISRVKFIRHEDFEVQKKWSNWYIVDMFVAVAKGCGMYDTAIAAGVITENTVVDGKKAEAWLKANSLQKKFAASLDGKELTPAISGPKPVMAFGSAK